MAKETKTKGKSRPTLSVEEKENEMIGLAVDLAEKQLRDGTAKSQVIVHYLKLASSKEKYEEQLLQKELELKSAKAEALSAPKRIEEMYDQVMEAMRRYHGESSYEYDEDI